MLFTALALGAMHQAEATEIGTNRPFGLGVQLGTPTGITGKVYLGGRKNAIDFALGSPYAGNSYFWGGFWAQAAYHWHVTELTSGNGVAIPFRVGVGAFVTTYAYGYWGLRSDAIVGLRVPFGLDFDLEDAPVQFWVEAALDVTYFLGVGVDGGIGARYYF
ncbi:MAG: hypothetical protein ABMB14_16185 [Myxococcota bacterium]